MRSPRAGPAACPPSSATRGRCGSASTATAVYRSDDAALSWRVLGQPHSPGGGTLAVSPAKPSTLFVASGAAASGGVQIHRTLDAGESWERFTEGLDTLGTTAIAPAALVIDECSEEGVYLGTLAGSLSESLDQGETW